MRPGSRCLVRHDVLMRMAPLTDEEIASIVDELVLPVLTGALPRPADG